MPASKFAVRTPQPADRKHRCHLPGRAELVLVHYSNGVTSTEPNAFDSIDTEFRTLVGSVRCSIGFSLPSRREKLKEALIKLDGKSPYPATRDVHRPERGRMRGARV